MTESFSTGELVVGRQIRTLADAGTRDRDASDVVRAVLVRAGRSRFGWLSRAAVATTLIALVVAVMATVAPQNQMGSSPATGQVRGITYEVAVARSIDLRSAQLTPFATATQDSGFATEDETAYQVDEFDPGEVLVMKLTPGEIDDAGSIGSYLVLVRGDGFSLLCDYFAADDPLAPSVCH